MRFLPTIRRRARRSAIAPSTWVYLKSEPIAREYDAYFRLTPLFEHDTAVLDEWLVKPGRLIDLGCGTGRHLLHFARRGFDVTGVDLSDPMLAEADTKLRAHGLSPALIKDDINTLGQVPDGAFDSALMMFSVFGLIRGRANRVACLRQVARVLKSGGLFALHVHNRRFNLWAPGQRRWFLRNLFDPILTGREIGDKIMQNYRGIPGMFLHLFGAGELRRTLRAAGFRTVRVHYLNDARDGPLRGALLRTWRANGFIFLAQKRADGSGC